MHTKGPWRVESGTTSIWGACDQSDASSFGMGYPIAEARINPSNPRWAKGPNEDEGEANAHLISSAPDLLGSLETLVRYAQWQMTEGEGYHPTLPSAVSMARAAIAKAKGTTNA